MIQKENTAKKGDFMSSAYYYLTEDEKDSVGWLGGNAPVWFDGKRDLVDEPGCHYGFYCTFQLKETGALCRFSFLRVSTACLTTTSTQTVP